MGEVKRSTTDQEKEVFSFLNELRDSGETNMFGAGFYIEDEFKINRAESRALLITWMRIFREDGNYEEIAVA